jgi:predicted RNA-binding Zn-ribbon protein involved in translation (DUF1610 family)
MPNPIARQTQHNGTPYVELCIRGIRHRLSAGQTYALANQMLDLLCPECGELVDGNTCRGCGTRFQYAGDTQPDTQEEDR